MASFLRQKASLHFRIPGERDSLPIIFFASFASPKDARRLWGALLHCDVCFSGPV